MAVLQKRTSVNMAEYQCGGSRHEPGTNHAQRGRMSVDRIIKGAAQSGAVDVLWLLRSLEDGYSKQRRPERQGFMEDQIFGCLAAKSVAVQKRAGILCDLEHLGSHFLVVDFILLTPGRANRRQLGLFASAESDCHLASRGPELIVAG